MTPQDWTNPGSPLLPAVTADNAEPASQAQTQVSTLGYVVFAIAMAALVLFSLWAGWRARKR